MLPVWAIVLLSILGFCGIIVMAFFFAACKLNKSYEEIKQTDIEEK